MTALLALLALPYAEATALPADGSSSGYHLAQAKQFLKNKWYDDAAREIESAIASGGDGDFEVNLLGAQVYYELAKMDRASALYKRAAQLAPNDTARDSALANADSLDQGWGQLTITAPYPGMRSRLQVDPVTSLIDPDQKRILNKITLQLHEQTALPVTVSLPVGEYLINGVAVQIDPAASATVPLEMRHLGAQGLAALQVSRLEVSPGVALLAGARTLNGPIAPNLEVAFTQPVGPVLLGLVADWTPRSYDTEAAELIFDPLGLAGGLRVGHEFAIGGPVALRPSLGVRYASVPGIELTCAWDDATHASATCDAPGSLATPAIAAYADGRAIAPYLEVAAEYRQGGRTTSLGVGVKAAVEEDLGHVAGDGTLSVRGADGTLTSVPYVATTTAWTATALRLSATIDFAF